MYGSSGPRVVELFETMHHLQHGTYVIYSPSNIIPKIAFLLGLVDKGVRATWREFWKEVRKHPSELFSPLYMQSIGIIQGPDLLEDGRVDMCESCPDMTVWDGKLVHSCRLDEWRLYGDYITCTPRKQSVDTNSAVIAVESIPVASAKGEAVPSD
jgi:hypothetical protein